jgi:beta-galactosidase
VSGFGHDLVRGLKQAPFWVMEQQPGQINWADVNPGLRPGAPRLWVWHAAASGAEGVVFFRWRAGLYGGEQLHAGLLHHDGRPDLGYREALALSAEREALHRFTQAPHQAQAALLMTYPDLWALGLQPHNERFSLMRHLFVYYRAFQRLGIQVDIVSPQASLEDYRLLAAPTLFLGDDLVAEKLEQYVSQGGTLLLGVRSGFKTLSNQVTDQPLPGVFRRLVGAAVSDWHSLPPGVAYDLGSDLPGLGGAASLWAERLQPEPAAGAGEGSAAALASYAGGPFAGSPALTERLVGLGRACYMGWFPSVEQAQALLAHLAGQAGVERIGDIPDGMVAIRRGGMTAFFNFTEADLALQDQGIVPARDFVIR